jgi:hypothetical protein
MRGRVPVLAATALLALLGGCGSEAPPPLSPAPPTTWTLFVERASVADPGGGIAPAVFVNATVAGEMFESISATAVPDDNAGFDASWTTPLFSADQDSLSAGVDLEVWADFGSGATLEGVTVYRAALNDFGGGVIDLGAFGQVSDLTLELTPN